MKKKTKAKHKGTDKMKSSCTVNYGDAVCYAQAIDLSER